MVYQKLTLLCENGLLLPKPDTCLKNPALPLENEHFVTVVNSFEDGDSIIIFFLQKVPYLFFENVADFLLISKLFIIDPDAELIKIHI